MCSIAHDSYGRSDNGFVMTDGSNRSPNGNGGGNQHNQELVPRVFDRLTLLEDRLASADAERMLLCLDFDGTLAPHVDDPRAAQLTAENRRVLETLDRHPAVDIAVITGRALGDVRDRVGMDSIDYAGNHGLEFEPGVSALSVERYRSTIQALCTDIETRLEDTACEVEDKGVTATVHYRNARADDIEDRVTSIVEESIENNTSDEDLRVTSGTEIVEIRPAIDWNKGHAVRQFEERCRDECFPLYIGDDTTDEDAFRAIEPEGIGVHVGRDSETAASYRVESVDEVTSFLEWIAETGINTLKETDSKRS